MRLIPKDRDLGWTPYAWTVYIVPFALTPLYTPRYANAGGWLMFGIATVVFLAIYLRSWWARGRELYLLAAATVLLGLVFWPIAFGAGAFFIYAAGMLGHLEPPRRAFLVVGIIAATVVVQAIVIQRAWYNAIWPFFFTILVGALNVHFAQVSRSNARLRLANDEIAHLAKVAERERIARDLHDVLGHTLSLVILKAELATKLADRDPARAREEIRDVERIAREALTEVRAAVTGYRAGGLQSEIQHARSALATAGVALECEVHASTPMPPSHEAVLCMALREAVTNIVRHAGAQKARLTTRIGANACTMTISDDGRGGNTPFGSGLTGMRERVEALGGALTRDGRHGTTLHVTLPLGARAEERTA
ncbi:MAG TPA: sensor histidine kinase [Thermoanaerobaculia bacterium]|jgi:two-component system sensor histidine kinase DesK|nr:sensor histidine kinase [Thermoanaerobaculia bacterium]